MKNAECGGFEIAAPAEIRILAAPQRRIFERSSSQLAKALDVYFVATSSGSNAGKRRAIASAATA